MNDRWWNEDDKHAASAPIDPLRDYMASESPAGDDDVHLPCKRKQTSAAAGDRRRQRVHNLELPGDLTKEANRLAGRLRDLRDQRARLDEEIATTETAIGALKAKAKSAVEELKSAAEENYRQFEESFGKAS